MGRCRPVSDSEADSMEAHCDGPEELALIRFFRHTAYRSNETASLVVCDLWDGHQVRDRVQIQARHMKKKVSPPADSYRPSAQASAAVLVHAVAAIRVS